MIGYFQNGEIEGLSIIMLKEGGEHICIMKNSKPTVIITDENEKNNIKISLEYKQLTKYYEKNKHYIEKTLKNRI
jgi:hypothetical protein